MAAVSAGERSAAVLVPEGILDAILEGTPAEIRVLTDPASTIKATIVQSMVERFAAQASAGGIMGRGIFHAVEHGRPLTDGERWLLAGWMLRWMYEAWSEPPISIEAADAQTNEIDVHSYFAPSFIVLFVLFTMLTSAKTIHEERETGTYGRLMAAPVSRWTFVGGKLVGSYLLAAIQVWQESRESV